MSAEDGTDGTPLVLTEAELTDDDALTEAASPRIVVPKKGGVFTPEGTCRVAIIRPCVSRGKALRGRRPIYTPQMLEANANVFAGWLMYMDHLTEAIQEAVKRRGRSMHDLGGRVVSTTWNPTFRGSDDDDFGFQPGAPIGVVRPRKIVREMIEDDPELLHVSINAYPTAAREGVAPWDTSVKGMLIEGIRAKPQGSVDWVPRGGAGGRVLQEVEERAVYLIEHHYDSRERDEDKMPNWTEYTTVEELAEAARGENPELASLLESANAGGGGTPTSRGGLTREDVESMLAEHVADEPVGAAPLAIARERKAANMIAAAGVVGTLREGLERRYGIGEHGVGAGLLLEGTDETPAAEVFEAALKADIDSAVNIMQEAVATVGPRVRGLGNQRTTAAGKAKGGDSFFRDFLRESGDDLGDDPDKAVKAMIQEGLR